MSRIDSTEFTKGCTAIDGKVEEEESGRVILCKKDNATMKLEKGWNPNFPEYIEGGDPIGHDEVTLKTNSGEGLIENLKDIEEDTVVNTLTVIDKEGNWLKLR